MPRLPRVKVEGAVDYVTSRAIQGEAIFKDKDDYKMYLDLVRKYKSQHKFKLYSYCLLPDRLELLIETGEDSTISEIMHDLNSLYTKYFNGRYNKRGHLFESRFRSVLVEKALHLAAMTRKIHRASGRPQEHAYSSFHIYRQTDLEDSMRPDMAAEVGEVLEFLRNRDLASSYEKYVLEGSSEEMAALDKSLRRGQVLGSDTFRRSVDQRIQEHTDELKEAASPAKLSRTVLFFVGGLVLIVSATSVYLYFSKEKVEKNYTELLKEKDQEFAEMARFENRSPIALTELDGTVWRVDLVALPADKTKEAVHDTVHFFEGHFWSELGLQQGFKPARYTIMIRPGALTTWEALQSDGQGNAISWRGDWQGDVMKGLSRSMPAGKSPQVFSFFSTGWSYAEAAHDSA